MGLFSRRKDEDRSVEALLAEANAASPTGPAAGAATPPTAIPAGDFQMTVQDVFSITGRGTVVTGQVETGTVRVGSTVSLLRDGGVFATTEVTGVEMFRRVLDSATVGDNVGLLLKGMDKAQLHTGDLVQG
jgi:translation elongation factor EF-Tu-like GTPase